MSDSSVDPRIGTTLLDKLRVDGLLGEGGMGAVYKVHHLVTKHDRALKVLHAEFADDEVIYKRLLREAGVAGTLDSDHVVETFDVGKLEDGSPYVLMELMKGAPLADRMDDDELSTELLIGFVCQAIEGMAHAHAAGIVHRDLKPDNLFVVCDEDGNERVKLLDFGISKFKVDPLADEGTMTQEGAVMGTPLYMSPEQALGKVVGPETDIYSLGVILYEGLAGCRPHDAQTFPEFLLKLHTVVPEPLETVVADIDPKLSAVVAKALAIEVEDRYRTAQSLLRELVPFTESGRRHLETLSGLPVGDAHTVASGSASKRKPRANEDSGPSTQVLAEQVVHGRRPWLPWAAIGVSLLMLVGVGYGLSLRNAEPEAPIAQEPTAEPAAALPPEDETPAAPEVVGLEPPAEEPPPAPPEPAATPAAARPSGAARRSPPAHRRGATEEPSDEGRSGGRFDIARDNPYE